MKNQVSMFHFVIFCYLCMCILCVVSEKRELKFDDKALHRNIHYHHHHQQHIQKQQQHVQKQQPQILQQQQEPAQHRHEIKPAEESMGLNLEQFMPQTKPSPQHREVDHHMDEEALFKKLGKGQVIHPSQHNIS